MTKELLFSLLLFFGYITFGQQCPVVSNPGNGNMDTEVNPTITWPAVNGINGYVISLGTTIGGKDIINSKPVGQDNFFTPPIGLPEKTTIYITLSLILFDGPPIICSNTSFTTMDVTEIPPCTKLVAPDDNSANVTIVTDIIWAYAPTAIGYRLSIGTAPDDTDILSNLDVGNTLLYDPIQDLPQGINIYITIIPYNENGDQIPCKEENFSTGAEAFDCDPIIDEITGEITYLKPQIDFPSIINFCIDQGPFTIINSNNADGFRWFRTNEGSSEALISQNNELTVTEPGRYRFEAYNNNIVDGTSVECSDFKLFNVVISEPPEIENILIENLFEGKKISITVSGIGPYEYALNDEFGPYQDLSVFENISQGPQTVYVRNKNGCGIVSQLIERGIEKDDFPNFFTPNGDGINDYWQFILPPEINSSEEIISGDIFIFDRYGNFLFQLDPSSRGWSGNFKGNQLPASDYWFKATSADQKNLVGHFTLKR